MDDYCKYYKGLFDILMRSPMYRERIKLLDIIRHKVINNQLIK